MSWWSDFKKKVKEFFTGETETPDTSPYIEGQNKINEQLKKMDEEFEASYDPGAGYDDISDLVPEEVEFVYREYTGDDENTIKDKTTQKYQDIIDSETETVNADYGGRIGQIETKKDNAVQEATQDTDELDKEYDQLEKEIRNSLVEKGMYRSSIKDSQEARNDELRQYDIDRVNAQLDSQLATYDADIEKLKNEQDAAIGELNIKYAQKLQQEIDDLLADRQKQIDEINKYNNDLKVKEAEYTEDRLLAIEKQLAERMKNELEIKELEQTVGYAGEKAENYEQRYQIAYDYYMNIPKEVATILIDENEDLRKYLGNYYTRLAAAVQKKQG